jgi:hypothetical protein
MKLRPRRELRQDVRKLGVRDLNNHGTHLY